MIRRIIIAALALMCIVPYTAKADTTLSERIYILSSIWKEISNNFAFPEKFKETNPDSLYRFYLTKVLCRKLTGVFGLNDTVHGSLRRGTHAI